MRLGYIGEEGDREVLRPVAPANLRRFIMHNHHASVYAVHHGNKTTLAWITARFWWPKMREQISQYVSRCKVCQMAKALKPANQGLLRGRRHSMAMNELCMDLVGPISAATGHDKHSQPLYIFVAIDPFTHMVWLECLPAKGGKNVFSAFVNRILLEEGAPRIIRCDNGTEFKNSMLNDLCRELNVQMQYSPAYWPQGNQCERLNRYLGETLRCMVNTKNGRKQDWHQYVKFIEFAYRSSPIGDTQLTPFEAARGRLPRLVSDNPMLDSELPASRSIDEHVIEMKQLMKMAKHELEKAKDKSMKENRDLQNVKRVDEYFAEGEVVMFYNRLVGSEGDPSKLRLRTYLYRVLSRENDIYKLQSVQFPDSTRRAHVGQLIRFKGDVNALDVEFEEAEAAAEAAAAGSSQTDELKSWRALTEGRFVALRLKTDGKAMIRCAEVVDVDRRDTDNEVEVWYYLDRREKSYNDFEMPLHERKLVPEYYGAKDGMVYLAPSKSQIESGELLKRRLMVLRSEVEILAPKWTLWTGGKVAEPTCVKMAQLMRSLAKDDSEVKKVVRERYN